ncbi:MAG: hypothetical protein NT058_01695 [Candidatus Portnoybacteria bacterium]|nr:hypothetical protein [Candidatus Portnoybacteria bacterium]
MSKKESIEKPKTLSVEEWEKLLVVELTDVTKEDFALGPEAQSKFLKFIVLPSMRILIGRWSHSDMTCKEGVDLDETVTEGYIEIRTDNIVFKFKLPMYQSRPKFEELDNNYLNFKEAVRQKVLEFIKE